MAANEIANALHACAVLELAATTPGCIIYGGNGIVSLEHLATGIWLVTLEQPLRMDAGPPTTVNAVPVVSHYSAINTILGAAVGLETHPTPRVRGNILIQQLVGPAPDDTTVTCGLVVLKLPTLG